jgi:hypothetical protein
MINVNHLFRDTCEHQISKGEAAMTASSLHERTFLFYPRKGDTRVSINLFIPVPACAIFSLRN